MDLAIRAAVLFLFVFLLTRIMGRRELSSLEPFDLILLIVMGDAIQQGLTQDDYSVTGAVIVVGTFTMLQVLLSFLSYKFPKLRPALDGEPIVVVQDGKPIEKNLRRERLTVAGGARRGTVPAGHLDGGHRLGCARDEREDQRHPEEVVLDSFVWRCTRQKPTSSGCSLRPMRSRRSRTRSGGSPTGGSRTCRATASRLEDGALAVMSAVDKERGLAVREDVRGDGRRRVVRGRALRGAARRSAVIEADLLGQLRTGAASGRRCEAPGAAGRADARRDRLRLAGAHAGRVHPRGAAGDRGGRRLLPDREGARRRSAGRSAPGRREPPGGGRLRRGRHDHDLARPGAARRVAAAGRARLRGRREPAAGARARQRRARARRVRLLRLGRRTRRSSPAT